MTRKNARWWLTFGAVTRGLVAAGRRSSRQLPNTGDQLAFSRPVAHVGAVYTLIPITAGGYLRGVLTRDAKLRETGLLVGEALVDGLIVCGVRKFATGRQRPLEGDGGGNFFHGSDWFPSGHTIGRFALASVIAHQYRDNKAVVALGYGLATMAGGSRFSARQHFGTHVCRHMPGPRIASLVAFGGLDRAQFAPCLIVGSSARNRLVSRAQTTAHLSHRHALADRIVRLERAAAIRVLSKTLWTGCANSGEKRLARVL